MEVLLWKTRNYQKARSNILNTSPMPSLYKAFATVDGDERRRCLIPPTLSPELSPPVPNQMAFTAPSDSRPAALFSKPGLGEQRPKEISSPYSRHCRGIPTALHVKSGNPTWILDSKANNHMTGELFIFSSPATPVTQSVRIADVSSIKIGSQGVAYLSSDITLLSDLTSKKIFGRGYECNGLYYFGDPSSSKVLSSSLQASILPVFDSSVFSSQTLDFWHARLRHANFHTHSLPGPVEETPLEDNLLLPRPAPILKPPSMSSPSLTSISLPLVITTDLLPYVPRCLRSNVLRRPCSHVPPPDSSPDSGTSPLPLASDITHPQYPPHDRHPPPI
ncbi:hypothetical protein HHK36_016274 [Tetracentron sinense]|uniref:GAG-pre-integrase domain-containing protein n=1 Tax=Tetracentron sinense TaxID=13715 RepID=A0A834Z2G5_TETSI|nr:hypothetical protein HHK36_016274 [Tetracentron sinense]